ncbi:MAG TPA: prepilin-type N-terminal cleavage/methylation domain-containing protein [Pyrinomonadaceae bacterium]|jgi:type IV pilus assembly protein PilW|nr:prepilin-type N-terminal cleavage/methylation domain-containing protein [Pyrinomonadaceae bacterium]
MQEHIQDGGREAGFSLVELMIAMAVTLVVMVLASTLVSGSFKTRTRENQKSDALADAQRALYVMSREIANSGFGLSNNGIVAADSTANSIRVPTAPPPRTAPRPSRSTPATRRARGWPSPWKR